MGFNAEIVPLPMQGWLGGLNRDSDPSLVAINEAIEATNVNFGIRGEATRRLGFTKYSTDDGASVVGRRIGAAFDDKIIVDADGAVFHHSGGATPMTTSSRNVGPGGTDIQDQVGFGSWPTFFYVTRLGGAAATFPPIRWDGTAWATLTSTAFDGTASRFPKAGFLLAMHGRMFAAHVRDASDAISPNRIYFSNLDSVEKWDALDFIKIPHGEAITGMWPFGDAIIITTTRTIWLISGTDPDSFALYPIDIGGDYGCAGGQSATQNGEDFIFFDRRRGLYAWNGQAFRQLDEKINAYILAGMNYIQAHKAVVAVHKQRLYLSVAWAGDSENSRTFVLELQTGAWSEYTYGVPSMQDFDATLFATGPNGVTGTFKLENGTTDAGVNIDMIFCSTWIAPSGQAARHRLRRVDMSLEALNGVMFTLEQFVDMKSSSSRTKTVTLDADSDNWGDDWGTMIWGTGLDAILVRLTGWANRWRLMRFQFKNITGDAFQLNSLVMQISVQENKRGTV